MDRAAPRELIPGLRLIRQTGEGAIGQVWLAELDGQRVAVKLLTAAAAKNSHVVMRFRREAEVTRRINSLHVVEIIDHGTTDRGEDYIVMEYLEGETLEERLGREGSMSLALSKQIVPQLGAALQGAHDAGVVHRDIKPANIFLTGTPEHPTVKVLDLGVAKDQLIKSSSGITGTGVAVGSPYVMSPEQVLGSRGVDHRTDLWSFGVVVYRLVCGRLPFLGSNSNTLALTICKGRYPQPSANGAPPSLDAWFARAFKPKKEERFESAREQADAFMDAVGRDYHPPDLSFEESTFDGTSTMGEDDSEAPTLRRGFTVGERDMIDSVPQPSTQPQPTALPHPPPMPKELTSSASSLQAVAKPSSPSAKPTMPPPALATGDAARRGRMGVFVALGGLLVGVAIAAVVAQSADSAQQGVSQETAPAPEKVTATPAEPTAKPAAPEPEAKAAPDATAASDAKKASDAKGESGAEVDAPGAAGSGHLTLICVPGCSDIRIDGSSVGPGPLFKREVDSGSRAIVLYQGALVSKRLSIDVPAGEHTTHRIVLPRAAASKAASTAAAATPSAALPAEPAEPAETPAVPDEPPAPAPPADAPPPEPSPAAPPADPAPPADG
jgi:serine/threonine-protein kinase